MLIFLYLNSELTFDDVFPWEANPTDSVQVTDPKGNVQYITGMEAAWERVEGRVAGGKRRFQVKHLRYACQSEGKDEDRNFC